MQFKLVLDVTIEADEVDPRRTQATQLRDLRIFVLHALGIGPPADPRHPIIRDAVVTVESCEKSPRHTTPLEGIVSAIAEDTTKRVDVDMELSKPDPKPK